LKWEGRGIIRRLTQIDADFSGGRVVLLILILILIGSLRDVGGIREAER
jgi:hypothetical protein